MTQGTFPMPVGVDKFGCTLKYMLLTCMQGEKEKNIADIHDFSIVLPTMEYHNQIWTWFDLLMAIRGDTKTVILSQVLLTVNF